MILDQKYFSGIFQNKSTRSFTKITNEFYPIHVDVKYF